MLAFAGGVQAAVIVDDFEASPALNLYQAKERGAVCSVEPAPEGGHGKAAKIAWSQTHERFQELYYARDVALPDTATAMEGRLSMRVYTDTANA
ncbi:MAG: hypothetical protein NTX50_32080, partial [Candidatus Sumerlaeota bacterium]|nr:hypothetical protein [Candidatus Sumerlaeota bacterium]